MSSAGEEHGRGREFAVTADAREDEGDAQGCLLQACLERAQLHSAGFP